MKLALRSGQKIPMAHSHISAGPATELQDGYQLLDLNLLLTHGREGFVAYEVTGDSMLDTILPGSIVVVDTWAEPHNGSIVAASVNGLTSIKIFRQSRSKLYLVPANDKYAPREVTATDSFHILGVVKGHVAVYG